MNSNTLAPANPFRALLSPEQASVLDSIRNGAIARFGFDSFRMEEGSGDNGSQEDQNGGTGAPAGTEQSGAPDPAAPPAGDKTGVTDTDISSLPESVQTLIAGLRKEAADASGKARENARAEAAEQAKTELAQQIGKALGLVKDDEVPTPEALGKVVVEKDSTIASLTAQNAVLRHGSTLGANVDALLNRLDFNTAIAGLDSTKDTYDADVKAAITKALEADTSLKAAPAVSKGGTPLPGSGTPSTALGDHVAPTARLAAAYGD